MAALVDTSVAVRYLVGDDARLAAAAAAIIESDEPLVIPPVALAETAYVLAAVYEVPREAVVDALIRFIQRRNVEVSGLPKTRVLEALLLCRPSGRVSFADALIWAEARAGGVPLYTLDERFPERGVRVVRP